MAAGKDGSRIVLGPNQYGKAECRLVKVTRDTERHLIEDLNVTLDIDHTFDRNHILAAQQIGLVVNRGIAVGAEHDLRHSLAIAQMEEEHATQIAAAMDPAHQHNTLARIGRAQRSAVMRAAQIA